MDTDASQVDRRETDEIGNQRETIGAMHGGGRSRKKLIVLTVVAVLIVGLVAGAWALHSRPSFCGTVCHSTMGSYLAGYNESDYLVRDHANAKVVCLDCHEAKIASQLQELKVQVSGDYRLPLKKMETTDEFCLTDGCHSRDDIAKAEYVAKDGTAVNMHAKTVDTGSGSSMVDPHGGGGDSAPCATCHTMHRTSKDMAYCFSCHHTETFASCRNCHDH